jgi:hypothetical protein
LYEEVPMTYLLRVEGEGEQIENMRNQFLASGITVSETHDVNLDSKQLSTPWTSPEVIEILKFITAVLQTSVATYAVLKTVRDALRGPQMVVVEREDIRTQLKINKGTADPVLKEFAERDVPPRV